MGSHAASHRQLVVAAAVVAVVAIGSMVRSVAGDFVWDDRWLVLESPPIRGNAPLFAALGRDYFMLYCTIDLQSPLNRIRYSGDAVMYLAIKSIFL